MKNTVNFEISNTILIVSNPEIKMLINFIVHTNCVEERNMRRLEKLFYYVDLCKRLIAAWIQVTHDQQNLNILSNKKVKQVLNWLETFWAWNTIYVYPHVFVKPFAYFSFCHKRFQITVKRISTRNKKTSTLLSPRLNAIDENRDKDKWTYNLYVYFI